MPILDDIGSRTATWVRGSLGVNEVNQASGRDPERISKTTLPAQNYMELKLNLSTFCGLLWALFGEQCDYYRELLKLLNILDTEECFTIRDAYTK